MKVERSTKIGRPQAAKGFPVHAEQKSYSERIVEILHVLITLSCHYGKHSVNAIILEYTIFDPHNLRGRSESQNTQITRLLGAEFFS